MTFRKTTKVNGVKKSVFYLLFGFVLATSAHAAEILVFAAASLSDAL